MASECPTRVKDVHPGEHTETPGFGKAEERIEKGNTQRRTLVPY